MDIHPDVAVAYLDRALAGMATTLGRVADDDLTTPPFGETTTSISGLVTHATEMCEFWLGHVGRGRSSARERDSEFTHRADRSELEERIAEARATVADHVAHLADGEGRPSEVRAFLHGDESDASLVIHVLEELYQHLGHMELTADALAARRSGT